MTVGRVLTPALLLFLASGVAARAGEGLVALQTAEPSCRTTTTPPPIYVDCDNGTVTDNRSGLVWLQNGNCPRALDTPPEGKRDWNWAMEFVGGLADIGAAGFPPLIEARDSCGLSDGSSPGEWRLPSIAEWEAMVADALGQGGDPDCRLAPPTLTNDSGDACYLDGPRSFYNVTWTSYWSSTTVEGDPGRAYAIDLSVGEVVEIDKTHLAYVWPVRGGQ
jgi:hypothetical protein